MSAPRISLPRKLLFTVVMALLTLGLAEVALRAAFGPPPPPVKVFGALGARERFFEVSDGQARPLYVPSASGETPSLPLRWDGPRVAVLGASSVHLGSGLQTSQEFPALLEARLGVSVLNLGSPGLDSFDLVRIAEEIAGWDLSVVVVYEGHNDLGNTYFQQRYGDADAARRVRARAALEHLQLFTQLARLLGPTQGTVRVKLDPGERQFPTLTSAQRQAAAIYFEANLRRIAWLMHERGRAVVLVTPASRLADPPLFNACEGGRCAQDAFSDAMQAMRTDPATAARLLAEARDLDGLSMRATTSMTDAMRRAARAERTWLVDAATQLPQDPNVPVPASWLFSDILHFSADGHQAMAQLIEPAVREALAQTTAGAR